MLIITIALKIKEKNTFLVIVCKDVVVVKYLKKHKKICLEINSKQTTEMPQKESTVEFKNFKDALKLF